MLLSIIIVNYNVRYFLEQCLASVHRAITGSLSGQAEVIVIDNASTDRSLDYLRPRYPGVIFIGNAVNTGFSRASNQGLARALGDFILFLNPDTLLPEDGCERAIAFLQRHPGAGAAGFRMLDGQGRFLRESKRGFPDAAASFYKMTGLAAAFPRSARFAAYYAGHLGDDAIRQVDILSGACLLVRKAVLDRTGGFDERFFMYAEDIDLSWRIRQAGYANYYLADIPVLHFKGESTRRNIRYVRQFYKAMHQFLDKYGKKSGPGRSLLRGGMWLREALAVAALIPPGNRRQPQPVSAVILGEPVTGDRLRLALSRQGLPEADQAFPEAAIVFCEGPALSWKSIIAAIAAEGPARSCLVHGRGTGSVVGGGPGHAHGRTISLEG